MCVFSSSIPLFSQADASEAGLLRYRWRPRLSGVLPVSISISAKVLIDWFPRHQWQRTKAEVRTKELSRRARQGFSASRFLRWSTGGLCAAIGWKVYLHVFFRTLSGCRNAPLLRGIRRRLEWLHSVESHLPQRMGAGGGRGFFFPLKGLCVNIF